MRRMDGVSAFMLEQESTGPYMHTLKIAILETDELAGGWSFDRFREGVARRIHLIPMFRWKFLKVPFGLRHPVLVDDPDFDFNYHVDKFNLCVLADTRLLQDGWEFIAYFREAFSEYRELLDARNLGQQVCASVVQLETASRNT